MTTSKAAREYGNAPLGDDEAWKLIEDKWLFEEWLDEIKKSMDENKNWCRAENVGMEYKTWKTQRVDNDELQH